MAEGGVAVSNRVVARNNMGRFIRECEVAAQNTIDKAVTRGAQLSRGMAPVGHKHDLRSIPIRDSISSHVLSRTSGNWTASARHAIYQEKGTGPHIMLGNPFFRFYWESKGRWWIGGLTGDQDVIHHPGNPPQPFLRPAYEIIMHEIMGIAKGEYPG